MSRHPKGISEWIQRCAQDIEEMPFRANHFRQDIARMIAKNIPKTTVELIEYGKIDKARKALGKCWKCGQPVAIKKGKKLKMCQFHIEQDRLRYWNGAKTSVAAD